MRVGRGVGRKLGEGARRGDRRGGRRAPHPRAATGGGRGRVSDTTRRRTGSERRAETTRKRGWNIGGSEPSGNGAGAKSRRGDGASAESDGRHRVGRVERRVADSEQRGRRGVDPRCVGRIGSVSTSLAEAHFRMVCVKLFTVHNATIRSNTHRIMRLRFPSKGMTAGVSENLGTPVSLV